MSFLQLVIRRRNMQHRTISSRVVMSQVTSKHTTPISPQPKNAAAVQNAESLSQHFVVVEHKHNDIRLQLLQLRHELSISGRARSSELERVSRAAWDLDDACQALQSTKNLLASTDEQERASNARDAVVAKVFNTTELCELVLLELDFAQLQQLQLVSHLFNDTIQNSSVVQRHMGFTPDLGSYFNSALHKSGKPLLKSCLPMTRGPGIVIPDHSLNLQGTFLAKERPTRDFTQQRRKKLICQPPLQRLNIWPDCCRNTPKANDAKLVLDRLQGVLKSDLLNAQAQLQKQHELCPWASVESHDRNAYVRVDLKFQACLQVRESDPTVLGLEEKLRGQVTRMQRKPGTIRPGRISHYIDIKRRAAHQGLPIPTLAELEKQGSCL